MPGTPESGSELNIEEIRQSLIATLKRASEAPEEKPDRILDSTDGPSKWRKGWFTLIIGYLVMAVEQNWIMDEELITEIKKKRNEWIDGDFAKKPLVTQEDIDEGNELLEKALTYFDLESQK